MEVRSVTSEELVQVCELEAVLFPDVSMSHSMAEREVAQAGRTIYGIGCYGQLDAYALVAEADGMLDILRLGVAPSCQGQGFGTALLRHILQRPLPAMLTVKKANVHARRLYQRTGFEIIGHYPYADAWVLFRPGP